MRPFIVCLVFSLFVTPSARAETSMRLVPPLDAPMAAGFVGPASDYGAGHRGVDYAVPVGTVVRAAGHGTVTFAGSVAGVRAVTIDHGSGLETTYTGLSRVDVVAGERIEEGFFLGTSGHAHGEIALHFGVLQDGEYVDPAAVLASLDVSGAIHLAPLAWTPKELGPLGDFIPAHAGSHVGSCEQVRPIASPERPPNDNIVVAVAGITSKTRGGVSADIYESGPELLGYPASATYRFSYAGTNGPRLHDPYEREDTYIDIRTAAARLARLMREVARRHPGKHVDLIAHSQGGIVARTFLAQGPTARDGLPVVDHLVTFASPHRGAPAASQLVPLREKTLTGRYVIDAAKALSERGFPIPDPTSRAVGQLAPGSELMRGLAREDTAYGTRVLTLAIPNDPVVPADHADIEGKESRMVPWTGFGPSGHSAIVTSPVAHGIAYSFLSGQAATCLTEWDERGRRIGSLWSRLESSLGAIYGGIERTLVSTVGPGSLVYDALGSR